MASCRFYSNKYKKGQYDNLTRRKINLTNENISVTPNNNRQRRTISLSHHRVVIKYTHSPLTVFSKPLNIVYCVVVVLEGGKIYNGLRNEIDKIYGSYLLSTSNSDSNSKFTLFKLHTTLVV